MVQYLRLIGLGVINSLMICIFLIYIAIILGVFGFTFFAKLHYLSLMMLAIFIEIILFATMVYKPKFRPNIVKIVDMPCRLANIGLLKLKNIFNMILIASKLLAAIIAIITIVFLPIIFLSALSKKIQ